MVPLIGNEVLQNRSLAINYYVTASTSMGWTVKDAQGGSVSNNGVTNSSQFNVASQLNDVNFASVKLGSTYDWGKPTTETDQIRTLNVTSQTTSIQNFQSSYQSGSGKSSTGFDISSSMYFLTQGFPSWDGYSIYNDPEVTIMVSKGVEPTVTPTPGPGTTATPQPSTQPIANPTTGPTNSPSNNNNNNGNSGNNNNNNPTTTATPSKTPSPTPAIPEFPLIALIPLMVAILLAVSTIKIKKQSGKQLELAN